MSSSVRQRELAKSSGSPTEGTRRLVSASSSSITGRGASTSGRAGSLIRTSNRRGTTSSG
jgi:hypothetical protein